ncbi:MAG: alanine--tRNA ligase [Magnetococcus sp. WYHC-3]
MTGNEIRKAFIAYFQRHGHTPVVASSLVPRNDPTLMFTNAGMNQFKGVFLGAEHRPYVRAVSAQKCVRAGGKHNDLENVGRTARHHTFFEMLGNFSFGDYFKEQAITLAWEFVTRELKLPLQRLLVTVYSEDHEAYDLWTRKMGLPAEKVIRIPTSDNFWSMGPTGPCGPCSEIFFDHGHHIPGGPPGSADADGDRFIEIWNLVFMQYNRDEDGVLHPLPNPCIDTGAGLERIAAIMQGVHNNYDSDLFAPLIKAAAETAELEYGHEPTHDVSLRVIADHLRSVCFLIADGVMPSNEGRGYVLRRIMRRAMRHGRMLGLKDPFLHKLVPALVGEMGLAYPELTANQKTVTMVIETEEKRFADTLGAGLKILEEAVSGLHSGDVLSGSAVFTLYDTYGFPVDLTADILRDRGIGLDTEAFEAHMAEQRRRARAAWAGSGDAAVSTLYHELRDVVGASEFLGYFTSQAQGAVVAVVADGARVRGIGEGQKGLLIVNQTPFYGESGGQVGDSGVIRGVHGAEFQVSDTLKPLPDLVVHQGRVLGGTFSEGDSVHLEVDEVRRGRIRLHHSATHLLHHALRAVLGSHVKQAGSQVSDQRLRLDFSHFQGLTDAELTEVEDRVNQAIWANDVQETSVMTPDQAVAAGAMALFGEKYGDEVRVVRLGDSLELCGGTHVQRTGDIGLMRIVSEGAVAAGVRRIEATCGPLALGGYRQQAVVLDGAARLMKLPVEKVGEGVDRLLTRVKELERELRTFKSAQAGNVVEELLSSCRDVAGIALLAAQVPGVDGKELRELAERLKDRVPTGVVLLGSAEAGKVSLVAAVSRDLTNRIKAGDIIALTAPLVGGKGGGRADMAQGGGTRPEGLESALAAVAPWLEARAGA